MLVYPRDGCVKTIVHAAILRQKLQIKLAIAPILSIIQGSHQENVKIPESDLMQANKIGTRHFHSENNGDWLIA